MTTTPTINIDTWPTACGSDDFFNIMRERDPRTGRAYYRVALDIYPPKVERGGTPRIRQLLEISGAPNMRVLVRSVAQWREREFPSERGWTHRIVRIKRSCRRRGHMLLRLGAHLEQAKNPWPKWDEETGAEIPQKPDYDRAILIEENIQALSGQCIAINSRDRDDEDYGTWPDMYVVFGRNVVRRKRGLEDIHV